MFRLQTRGLLRIVALRYKLLWASLRTNRGRAALLSAAMLLVCALGLLLSLGGIGAGVAAVQMGKTQLVARAILISLLAGSVGFSLSFGLGAKTIFEDRSLRHFPLDAASRFAARQLVGLLDPVWLLVLMCTLGLAVGLQIMGACSILIGAPVVVLFVLSCYLASALLQTVLHKLLQLKSAALLLTIAIFGLTFLVLFAIDPGPKNGHERAHIVSGLATLLVNLTPAAPAASALAGNTTVLRVASSLLLVVWIVTALAGLSVAERVDFRRHVRVAYDPERTSVYDWIANLFSSDLAPFIAKSLRYHLRCNRVRYMMVVAGPLIGMQFIINARRIPAEGKLTALFALVYIVAPATTFVMALNHFGWDAAGVGRYPLLPVRMATVLRAYSLVSMTLGAIATLPFAILFIAIAKVPMDWKALVLTAFDMVTVLFVSHAIAPWLAVKAPRRVEFDSMMGNVFSGPAQVANLIVILPGLALFIALIGKHWFNIASWWWVMPPAAIVAAIAYWYSVKAAGRAMEARREKLVHTLSPTGD